MKKILMLCSLFIMFLTSIALAKMPREEMYVGGVGAGVSTALVGSGSAGSSEIFTTRRGLEKSLFSATIVFVAIFILSILGLLLIPS